jgi:hypothetical protein
MHCHKSLDNGYLWSWERCTRTHASGASKDEQPSVPSLETIQRVLGRIDARCNRRETCQTLDDVALEWTEGLGKNTRKPEVHPGNSRNNERTGYPTLRVSWRDPVTLLVDPHPVIIVISDASVVHTFGATASLWPSHRSSACCETALSTHHLLYKACALLEKRSRSHTAAAQG